MKKCKWYEFHKWVDIYGKEKMEFMGEPYYKYVPYYKQCKKCGIIKGFINDSQGGYWQNLSDDETRIIKRHIVLDTLKNVLVID